LLESAIPRVSVGRKKTDAGQGERSPARDGLEKIVSFYSVADEKNRLTSGLGVVEFARTKEIVKRYLPPPPRVVLDVGGAVGRYSCWLAREGYEVHLVDPVPALVEEARRAAARQPEAPVASLRVGDARKLGFPDATADAVLLLGPLYHLVEAADRKRALQEAHRVLKTGGYLFAAGISRFASALEALINGHLADGAFVEIVRRDLRDGQHRNTTANLTYFTDAYFHRPGELRREVQKAGFAPLDFVMVDPFGYSFKGLEEYWEDGAKREQLMDILRELESEPSLMGAGPHLMCVAHKAP
jgi:ubiquinone/menaquinone biosynthesis C-methylase UbiE